MKSLVIHLIVIVTLLLTSFPALCANGKLIGTAGLMQIEGAGGGGIIPWATLAGYDSQDEISFNVASNRVDVDDYRLNVLSASLSIYDRVEISISQQLFDVQSLNTQIEQQVIGLKVRLFGDVVYSNYPQVSMGWQHKKLKDGAIASALGADNSKTGNDLYVAATKVHLGAIAGFNALWNVTARATKANQMGLLGFGSASDNNYQIMFEGSAGILLSRYVAVGVEFRQKPNNLGLGEEHWRDIFISYIPSKSFSATFALVNLGSIAGAPDQKGVYLSLQGSLQ